MGAVPPHRLANNRKARRSSSSKLCSENQDIYDREPHLLEQLFLGERAAQYLLRTKALPFAHIKGMMQVGKTIPCVAAINYLEHHLRKVSGQMPVLLLLTSQNSNQHPEQMEEDKRRYLDQRRYAAIFVGHPSRLKSFRDGATDCSCLWTDIVRFAKRGHPIITHLDEDHQGINDQGQFHQAFLELGIDLANARTPKNCYLLFSGATSFPTQIAMDLQKLPAEAVYKVPEPPSYVSPEQLLARVTHVDEGLLNLARNDLSGSAKSFIVDFLQRKPGNLIMWADTEVSARILEQAYIKCWRTMGLQAEVYLYASVGAAKSISAFREELKASPKRHVLRILLKSYGAAMRFYPEHSRYISGVWIGCSLKYLESEKFAKNPADFLLQKFGRFCGHGKQGEKFPIAAHKGYLEWAVREIRLGHPLPGTHTKARAQGSILRYELSVVLEAKALRIGEDHIRHTYKAGSMRGRVRASSTRKGRELGYNLFREMMEGKAIGAKLSDGKSVRDEGAIVCVDGPPEKSDNEALVADFYKLVDLLAVLFPGKFDNGFGLSQEKRRYVMQKAVPITDRSWTMALKKTLWTDKKA